MPSTTVKLEAELARKVTSLKPAKQSISAYVRGLIEKEHRERQLRAAAQSYEQFLHKNSAEREAMEVWASAPLSDTIEPGRQL
jgi:predicted CopG family antitoxin